MPIAIPEGVVVEASAGRIRVSGPRGVLERSLPGEIEVAVEDGTVVCRRSSEHRKVRALHGLVRALVSNMVAGVHKGFTRNLLLQGVGYRASAQERSLNVTAGHSHPVEVPIPDGLSVATEQISTNPPIHRITISGIDKEQVGQFAADVRALRPVEPYKMKGFRYDDETVRKKAGKTGAGGKQ